MPAARLAVLVVGAGLALAACADGGREVATAPSEGTAPGRAPSAPAPAEPGVAAALRFTAPGVDGTPVVGAHYAGRDVAMWFWAPW